MTQILQGDLNVGETESRTGTDHTSEIGINMKAKSARKEILNEWLIWYSFQAGEMTIFSEHWSVMSLASQQPETWMPQLQFLRRAQAIAHQMWLSWSFGGVTPALGGPWMKDLLLLGSKTVSVIYGILSEYCEVKDKVKSG